MLYPEISSRELIEKLDSDDFSNAKYLIRIKSLCLLICMSDCLVRSI